MKLEFDEKERNLLVTTLENFLPELRGQIASGVRYDWKKELKSEKMLLENILFRLKLAR